MVKAYCLSYSCYFVANIDSMFFYEVYPLGILDACNDVHTFAFSSTARNDVVVAADGGTMEFGILSLNVIYFIGFQSAVFVGELKSVSFVKKVQHCYFDFHIIVLY